MRRRVDFRVLGGLAAGGRPSEPGRFPPTPKRGSLPLPRPLL